MRTGARPSSCHTPPFSLLSSPSPFPYFHPPLTPLTVASLPASPLPPPSLPPTCSASPPSLSCLPRPLPLAAGSGCRGEAPATLQPQLPALAQRQLPHAAVPPRRPKVGRGYSRATFPLCAADRTSTAVHIPLVMVETGCLHNDQLYRAHRCTLVDVHPPLLLAAPPQCAGRDL